MLDEAEGTQLEQKTPRYLKTNFWFNKKFEQEVSEVIFWDPHSFDYFAQKKINHGKCQNATKGW